MSAGRFALDTNVAIHYLAGQAEVRDRIETSSSRFALGFATVGELYFGAYKLTRVAENRARVDEHVASFDVLLEPIDVTHELRDQHNSIQLP